MTNSYCFLHMAISDYGVNGNSFKLERAICNHGFFMMPPNHWDTLTNTFTRPLRLTNSLSLTVTISQQKQLLLLKLHGVTQLSPPDQHIIKAQVARMLRLSIADENCVQEFHKLHPDAKNQGFGRMFRSPSLFEDIVKTFLLCNCNWKRSLDMAKKLCELQYKIVKRKNNGRTKKRKRSAVAFGNFPSAEELSCFTETQLKKYCNLGYRANFIRCLAGDIVSAKLELQNFEIMNNNNKTPTQIMASLETISGVSKFTSANIMMCLGYYQFVPCDTETIRHLKEFHRIKDCSKANVTSNASKIYETYAPFHCLAYWFELIKEYERQVGKPLSELKESEYMFVTAPVGKAKDQ